MRELRILREVDRREAATANGRHVYNPTHQNIHARFSAQDLEHMTLPEDTDNMALLQKTDGSFYFVLGISEIGGPDTLA